jgi:hypothetical protein
LQKDETPIYAHALNLCEVFYHYSRRYDVLTARGLLEMLAEDGVLERADLDVSFREDVAQLKADWKRVSLADCVGVALSRRLNASFVTTDHHELDALRAGGACRMIFIR